MTARVNVKTLKLEKPDMHHSAESLYEPEWLADIYRSARTTSSAALEA
jgi:hypothetical protein